MTMYIDNAMVNVLGNNYKSKTVTTHEFKFNEGITARDFAKFLDSLSEDQGHRFCGVVMLTVTIDTRGNN